MFNTSSFLARSLAFFLAMSALTALNPAAAAMFPPVSSIALPLRAATPELLGVSMLALGAFGLALLQLRRSSAAEERGRALERQLEDERSAHGEAEDALAGSHDVLCRLVRQQESVRDAERSRIARALHDELGHRLLALRAELSLQQAAVRGTSAGVHERLSTAIGNLDAAIRSVRAIAGGLRPIAPGTSLRQAAERHLAEFARLHGLDYRLDLGSEPACGAGGAGGSGLRDRELDAVLFRALQEALSNVACHAQACVVRVTLVETSAELTLTVEDDGVGLTGPVRHGAGLDGVRERATAFGGTVRLAAGRRGGAVVRVSIPAQAPAPAPA